MGRSKAHGEKRNRVVCFRGDRWIPQRCSGRTHDVVCATALSAGAVGPENDGRDVFAIQQRERRTKRS